MDKPAYAARIAVSIPALQREPVMMAVAVPNGPRARHRACVVAQVIALVYAREASDYEEEDE